VVPSYYESFGLVALESLASGTPVVATKVGAMESILQDGKTGQIVSNGSATLLADGIRSFITRSLPASTDMIRASVRQFSWENVASAMIDEYTAVLRQYQIAPCCGKVSSL
jgi:D-inositol-3-phosphate glycosyltransferase